MGATAIVQRALAPARVRAEHLNVTPELLGAPLASPGRRLAAIAVDAALVGVLSSTGMFWCVAGIGALAIQLRQKAPRPAWRAALMWLALAALVVVAAALGTEWVVRHAHPSPAALAANDDADGDDDAPPLAVAAPAVASAASGADPVGLVVAGQALRIRSLESQLAQMRRPEALSWRAALLRRLHRLGLSFAWAIAYFTLLPTWWRGQTVGKRLFRLRVRELTGKPPGLMLNFGRYGGYAAGLATGGIGFAQVLWDPNRQAVEDKLAHKVVVDERSRRD